ncbi:MAG: TetR/AcrR family transcriptional regulator [Acidimicrobiales bacterium]
MGEAPNRLTARAHRRNARGQGGRLAAEIVAGALAIVDRTGSDEGVTLRSVAREVGIAAPSIYPHFVNRDAIVLAVDRYVFDDIGHAVEAAVSGLQDPVERLLAGCETYVAYGMENAARYRVLFARELPGGITGPPRDGTTVGAPTVLLDDRFPPAGGEVFALLVEGIERCAAAGRSAGDDPFGTALAVWVALHGMVSLWTTLGDFPWPDRRSFTRRLVLAQVGIDGAQQ